MSENITEIITFHGWGFSPGIWSEWEQILAGTVGVSVQHADRGYFGKENIPSFRDANGSKILMVHSFGLHWCPQELIRSADHLIIISGFLSFHPETPREARKSKLVLRQMKSRFVDKPMEVLTKFYENVYTPAQADIQTPGVLNHDQLLEDLEWLGTANLWPDMLHKINGITIIHGEDDRIVSNSKARELFAMLRGSQYFEIKHAGHGVAFTHTEECFRFLKPVVQ